MNQHSPTRPSLLLALPAMIALGMILVGCAPKSDVPAGGDASSSVSSGDAETVVYFSNEQLNPNAECATVHPVSRDHVSHPDRRFAALSELLRGPTDAEKAEGYASFFSGETEDALRSLSVQNGTAYVNLRDLRQVIPNASSSCGSAALLAQIESTLKQFPGVSRVIIAFDGDTQTFYDWIQIGCGAENDHCDNTPFRSGQGVSA